MNPLFDALLNETVQEYQSRFSEQPECIVAAPGRVNLIGEHTDYNDGFVFPMAIERYTVIAAGRKTSDSVKQATLFARDMNEQADFLLNGDEIRPTTQVSWKSYVQGSIACSLEQGLNPPPFQAVIHSNVPLGGGLSSSASLEVAVATLMEELSGKTVDPVKKALLCQKAEHEFAHMPCGIMDQFISVLGVKDHAMLLDCRSQIPTMIPLDDPGISVLIINSNVKHELTGSEYPERRSSCEKAAEILGIPKLRDASSAMLEEKLSLLTGSETGDLYYRRARHVVTEDERTIRMAEALKQADWETVGEQMYASHQSMKNDYEITCPEIDLLVDIARQIGFANGVVGSRMTGGGFGGCTVSLVRTDKAKEIGAAIQKEYSRKTGIEPTLFTTRPAQGAFVLKSLR